MEISTERASLTSVEFNNIKYSMIGGSTDSGNVSFWDVNSAREIHSFGEHNAPATDLAFSPLNEVLVVSSGLDKRCLCYDTMTKKPASKICTDLPLTSVDFAPDGTHLVLGTTQVITFLLFLSVEYFLSYRYYYYYNFLGICLYL